MGKSVSVIAAESPPRAAEKTAFVSPGGDQLLPPLERHGAVADARDLSVVEDILPSRFRPDRPDHADVSTDRVPAATAGRLVHRSPSDALFAGDRHGLHAGWPAAAFRSPPPIRALLFAAALVGMGSAVFHPESSRVARMASGGQHGLAQSLFQVGGNAGTATGPLLAAFIVLRSGQQSIAWFSLVALLGIVVLSGVGRWAKQHLAMRRKAHDRTRSASRTAHRRKSRSPSPSS